MLATFTGNDVNIGTDEIAIMPYLGFMPGDPVKFSIYNSQNGPITGSLPAGLELNTTYYVIQYTKNTGILKISNSENGASVNITGTGVAASPNKFKIEYANYAAVVEVQSWSFEFSRTEIDVTTIGKMLGQYAPFRSYIAGFADGNGTVNVYLTDEDKTIASRIVDDVLKRQQVGASVNLYIDKIQSGGIVDDGLSRSIQLEVILTSANLKANPDDAAMVSINFRPSGTVTPDFSQEIIPPLVISDYWNDISIQLYSWQEIPYIGWWGN